MTNAVQDVQRLGQSLDHLLHEGLFGNRIRAFDIGAQFRRRPPDNGLRYEGLALRRRAVGQRRRAGQALEGVGVHRNRRNAAFLQGGCKPDDRRAAAASQTDPEDGRIAVPANRVAHVLVVDPAFARADDPGLDRWKIVREPVLHLVHEFG